MRLPLALLAAALLLVGCGKSNPSATPTATRAPGVTQGSTCPPTCSSSSAAQARTFVAAVNLTAADVPGLHRQSEPHQLPDAREREAQAHLLGCFAPGSRAGRGGALAEGGSGTFQARAGLVQASVSSDVSVAHSGNEAALELRVLRSPRSRTCLSRFVGDLLASARSGPAHVSRISISQGDPPAPGTTGGFGFRITATLATTGVHVPLYMDILGFVDGPADVTLMSTGFPVPFPAAVEERLFSLLVERADVHRP